jgi:S1-C subfamily serine protease
MRFCLPAATRHCKLPLAALFLMTAVLGASAGSHHGSAYLGVDFENLTSQQRSHLGVPAKEGVMIAAVDHDAPAGKAELRANDVILQMNGKKAENAEDLREALQKMKPGDTVTLNILRENRSMDVSVVLADRHIIEQQAWSQHYRVPDPRQQPEQSSSFLGTVPSEIGKTFSANGGLMSYIPGTLPYTGIMLDVMNPQLAHYFGLRGSTGLLVKSVDADSPGARAGLQAGDVICKANDAPIHTRSEWGHVLKDNRHESIKLQVLRNRQRQTLLLTLAASKS